MKAARLLAQKELGDGYVVLVTRGGYNAITRMGLADAAEFSDLGEHEIRNFGKLKIFGINR